MLVLVYGGSGQLGRAVVDAFKNSGLLPVLPPPLAHHRCFRDQC